MIKKHINLALQGGGAHGAFTWGVLDVLLRDEDIEIASISGTSAGALNAAALKAGMVQDGRAGAIENLDWLWEQVGAVADTATSRWLHSLGPSTDVMAKAMELSPMFATFDFTTRMMSPYVYGPLLQNPLEKIVRKFDYNRVCETAGPQINICATNVRSGKVRVFSGTDISAEAIMASACLPTVFQAIELDDPKTGKREAFWDGGYTGNPALFPMFHKDLPSDILVININPLHREELPTTSQAIANRINEISFNSSLLRELRAIHFVKRLLKDGSVKPGTMKDVLVHMISDDALMNTLNVATKTIPTPMILQQLKDAGQAAAKTFLIDHKADLNTRSSLNLDAMFN